MKPKDGRPALRERSRRVRRAAWAVALFFAIGYFPTVLLGSPVLSMAVAACVAIPYGSRCERPGQGAVRGGLVGTVAGLAMAGGLFGLLAGAYRTPPATQPASQPAGATRPATAPATAPADRLPPPIDFSRIAAATVGGSVVLCAAAAAMAAHLGKRRRKMIEDQWHG